MLPRSTLQQDDSTYDVPITGNTARAFGRLSMFGEFGGPSNPDRDEPDPSDAAVTDSGTSSIGSSAALCCCPAMTAAGKGGSTPCARPGCREVASVLSGCSNPGLLDDCPLDWEPVSALDWLISRSSIGSSIPGELGFGDLFESFVITLSYISHFSLHGQSNNGSAREFGEMGCGPLHCIGRMPPVGMKLKACVMS